MNERGVQPAASPFKQDLDKLAIHLPLYIRVFTLGRLLRLARVHFTAASEAHVRITSKRTLDDMELAAERRARVATAKAIMNQMGTTGTILSRASRARRKVRMGKAMHLTREVVGSAPSEKLSPFVPK